MARRSLSKEIEDIREKLGNHSIVLVGLMGAGKSSIGRRLAEKLDVPFVDADHEIELAADKTIPEIFKDHGEAYFREGERRVISRLIENGAQVLSTGGGAFINEETRQGIQAHGISVWLKADLSLLMKRVMKRADRPLLQSDDPALGHVGDFPGLLHCARHRRPTAWYRQQKKCRDEWVEAGQPKGAKSKPALHA